MNDHIKVYCDTNHVRPKREGVLRTEVAFFSRGLDGQWSAAPAFSARHSAAAEQETARQEAIEVEGESAFERALRFANKGDKPESFQGLRQGVPLTDAGALRHRYRLECELCHLTVPARGEKVQAVFDRLAQEGVSEVRLADLAPILRS